MQIRKTTLGVTTSMKPTSLRRRSALLALFVAWGMFGTVMVRAQWEGAAAALVVKLGSVLIDSWQQSSKQETTHKFSNISVHKGDSINVAVSPGAWQFLIIGDVKVRFENSSCRKQKAKGNSGIEVECTFGSGGQMTIKNLSRHSPYVSFIGTKLTD